MLSKQQMYIFTEVLFFFVFFAGGGCKTLNDFIYLSIY